MSRELLTKTRANPNGSENDEITLPTQLTA
jgi:hypothetical protein